MSNNNKISDEELIQQVQKETLEFARESVSLKVKNVATRKVNLNQVITAMENPHKNVLVLQDVSSYLKNHSGVYARILNYFSNILTYDYILYPAQMDGKNISKDKLQKGYVETASYLDTLNVKYTLSLLAKRLFELGEVYNYKIQDNDGVIFKEMPNSLCRITSVQNNVCKYAIDLNKISSDKDLYITMPKDIQKIVDRYSKGSIKEDKLIDKYWFELEENAYAFNMINPFLPKGYPPFIYMFDALIHLMELEEIEFTNAKIENLKIIHQKLPMDKDGKLLVDIKQAKQYHTSTKKNLPDGIAITTNPLELQSITLQRAGNQQINYRNNAIEGVFDISGVNSELFNGKSSNTQAIKNGVQADELIAGELITMFENFLNADLMATKKTGGWRIKILDNSHFSREENIKRTRENLAYGGSRLHFLGTNGFTPMQSLNILKFEQEIGIDDLLTPQLTSHTITKDDIDNKNVTPKDEVKKEEENKDK